MGIPIFDVATVAVGVLHFTHQFVPPVRRAAEYATNKMLPNQVPSIADAIELRRRGLISKAMYEEYLLIQGWDLPQSRNFWKVSETQLNAESILLLYWREEITIDEYEAKMKILGYTRESAALFNQSRKFYPSPNDLVSWQAREVFEEDAVKKYGLDDEYELIAKESFFKAGMTEEQIRNFWRAHWVHPSLNTIYQLLHRGILDEQDVYEYYRLVEIPPYWREGLTKLSYPPYTRVDTRRMYQMNVLTREEVFTNYRHLGYDLEKAENMTEFTVAFSTQKDKDLTRSQIERAYEYGIITPEVAIELLHDLGYDESESLFILSLKMYAMAEDELEDVVATIKTRFRRGLISQEEAIADLDNLEISSIFRDKVVAEILRVKSKEFQLPSKTDLLGFYKAEIINKEEFESYMDRIGFQPTEIALYVESLESK